MLLFAQIQLHDHPSVFGVAEFLIAIAAEFSIHNMQPVFPCELAEDDRVHLNGLHILAAHQETHIPIDQLCDTVHVVVGSLQFQLTTKNEIDNPFWGLSISFFCWDYFATAPLYNNPALQFGRNA
jgi:hypothetical protein